MGIEMNGRKKLWIGVGAVVIAAVVLGIVLTRSLLAQKEREDTASGLQWFCSAANLSGRWVSEDGGFSLLVYMDDKLESCARLYTDQGLFEGAVEDGAEGNGSLMIRADGEETAYPQIKLTPVEMLDDSNQEYRVQVTCYRSESEEQDMGEYEIKFVRLVDESDQVREETMESWINAINQAVNGYYGTALGVMDVELERDGVYDANGGYVGHDGLVHGTGIIAPVSEGVFQLGSSEISFTLDIAGADVKVWQLTNTTSGDVVVEGPVEDERNTGAPVEEDGSNVQASDGVAGQEPTAEAAEQNSQLPGGAPLEGSEAGEDGQQAEQPVTVTEQAWKQTYYDILMQKATYQYNGNDMNWYSIYLIDADDNGIPELYVCEGLEPSLMLHQAYDFSTGRLESAQDLETLFVPYVAINKNTGERVLYGDNGGVLIWDTIMLRPIPGKLDFETVVISHTGKEWNEEIQGMEAQTQQVSEEYQSDDFEVNYNTQVLSRFEPSMPSESEIRDFLGL